MGHLISLDTFVKLSAKLTGFDASELRATGMAHSYQTTIMNEIDDSQYERLVEALLKFSGDPLTAGDLDVLDFARAITYLWYVGVWPRLPEATHAVIGRPGRPNAAFTVTARGYAEGLVWKCFHGNAPGTAAPGFASWSDPPKGARALAGERSADVERRAAT
uniref:Uncharacterized protein n=1 Tax=Streptosporangium amethystogenes TaxID=2002 RepID=M4ZRG9_9ACTN|nr:hypothetical protein [Streptosporangium amethystogenes]